ncbi:hypothetical protein [Methanosarcina mazei]|uniref:Uncharacterized protein n=1 Tax=Methanosarcina mazei TaxID=2209 RepID=A0A0F8ITQ0_METMZ|nr:hypothetical protein [Methanosarcina mazei]KKG92446.1 hypothetical protein DU66_10640 [Methanosarcina mazei]KKG95436.1 hypothetical protein DU69_06250 [Methanosarcina mazei]KKG95833.1 hypothetical protein DU68_16385 [Methanosarcina mazei]KKH04030.1 hypothetical protein DU56_16040 [Methanosarcina mazei]
MFFTNPEEEEKPEKSEKMEKLWERSVDKKERLVQTYTVIYSLLISFGQNTSLNAYLSSAVDCFFYFLIWILVYHTALSRLTYDKMFDEHSGYGSYIFAMEASSFIASYLFSFAVVTYMGAITGDTLFNFWIMVYALTLVVFSSLSVIMIDWGLYGIELAFSYFSNYMRHRMFNK